MTDDSINTGNDEYQSSEGDATKSFITKKKDVLRLRFLDYLIEHDDTALCVSQPKHVDRLHVLDDTNIDRDALFSMCRQLLFVSQSSRHDISYNVSQLCQLKYEDVKSSDEKLLNDGVEYLKATKDLKLR